MKPSLMSWLETVEQVKKKTKNQNYIKTQFFNSQVSRT